MHPRDAILRALRRELWRAALLAMLRGRFSDARLILSLKTEGLRRRAKDVREVIHANRDDIIAYSVLAVCAIGALDLLQRIYSWIF